MFGFSCLPVSSDLANWILCVRRCRKLCAIVDVPRERVVHAVALLAFFSTEESECMTREAGAPPKLESGAAYDVILEEIKLYATSEGTYALPYVSVLFCALPAFIIWFTWPASS